MNNCRKWPSQDQVDRSNHIAVMAFIGPAEPLSHDSDCFDVQFDADRELRLALNGAVELALEYNLGGMVRATTVGYLYGPQCQSWQPIVSTLFEHGEVMLAIGSSVADAYTLATFVKSVNRHFRKRTKKMEAAGLRADLVFPPGVLAVLCESYVRKKYHPRARLRTDWFTLTTDFWDGFRSPAHPGPDMEYIVHVRSAATEYVFTIDGRAQVTTFRCRDRRGWTILDCPRLLDTSSNESLITA